MTIFLLIESVLILSLIGGWYWYIRRHKSYLKYQDLKKKYEELDAQSQEAQKTRDTLSAEAQSFQRHLESIKNDISQELFRLTSLRESLKQEESDLRKDLIEERDRIFEELSKKQIQSLTQAQKEFVNEFKQESNVLIREKTLLDQKCAELKSTIASAVEISKHKLEEENQINFYKLQIDPSALTDIGLLRSIEPKLKHPEAINKVIWKIYYEKPYTDLIGREGLSSPVCGIYKITNVVNEMTYVGQAVNIGERWRQHIKRGLGADMPTQNKLYPAMKKFGPENFTFEVIEKCSKDMLNKREDFWQDFYKAKEFGYSIK